MVTLNLARVRRYIDRCKRTLLAVVWCCTFSVPVTAQTVDNGPGPGPFGPGPGCNFFPASAATGTGVDITYFGPPPSTVNPSLVGPVLLLKAGTVDFTRGTVTLPLYKGRTISGKTVWYILTDTSDQGQAAALGLNYSSKLTYSGPGARRAVLNASGELVFARGGVNFAPDRSLTPGPADHPFPPVQAQPGSVGDSFYSPIVYVENTGFYYNAPIVAYDVTEDQINFPSGNPDYRLVHDGVVAINPQNRTVTLNLVPGFSFGRPFLYLSTDASTAEEAAIERATYAPYLQRIQVSGDDSFTSAVERNFPVINGQQTNGCNNPQRQGLNAALTDGYRPNNTFGGIPTLALDYSPLWDVNLWEWTPDAVASGYRGQLREEFQILTYAQDGLITGPNGTPFGSSGAIVNCAAVYRLV